MYKIYVNINMSNLLILYLEITDEYITVRFQNNF